jgi:hypothetical protein
MKIRRPIENDISVAITNIQLTGLMDKVRSLKEALDIIDDTVHIGTSAKLVREAGYRIGWWHTCNAILKMKDSRIRNTLALECIAWITSDPEITFLWLKKNRLQKEILNSEHVTPEQLMQLQIINPDLARKIAKRALIFAAENAAGTTYLLLYLAKWGKLKKQVRVQLASAVLGMDTVTTHDLMDIIRNIPALRRDAAAIVLTRSTLLPSDVDCLLGYPELREMVAIMRPV